LHHTDQKHTFVSLFIIGLNKMCRTKVLANNRHGYITRCENCAKVQLAFGTSLLGITIKEFEVFANYLYTLRQEGDAFGLHEKKVFVQFGESNMMMLLTPCELENFIELVETASIQNLIHESLIRPN
jgi:hypothetical protein